MRIAIHQPNYLPWIGYFFKILESDVFIFLDDVQFSKNSYQNRVKIKTPQGPKWLTQSVQRPNGLSTLTNEVVFSESCWFIKHKKTLQANYGKAKYFDEVMSEVFSKLSIDNPNQSGINIELIKAILNYLGIQKALHLSSEFKVGSESNKRLIELVKKAGGTTYVHGKGGLNYQENELFEKENIAIEMTKFRHPTYDQEWGDFEVGLSIIDLLMNSGRDSINVLSGSGKI